MHLEHRKMVGPYSKRERSECHVETLAASSLYSLLASLYINTAIYDWTTYYVTRYPFKFSQLKKLSTFCCCTNSCLIAVICSSQNIGVEFSWVEKVCFLKLSIQIFFLNSLKILNWLAKQKSICDSDIYQRALSLKDQHEKYSCPRQDSLVTSKWVFFNLPKP